MDIFHTKFRDLSPAEKDQIENLKINAAATMGFFNVDSEGKGKDRETSLAITKLEEAVMWAVKSITK